MYSAVYSLFRNICYSPINEGWWPPFLSSGLEDRELKDDSGMVGY
jgi:hypothetical protein